MRQSCTSCSVHDIVDLESRGVPSMFVASTEFVQAAEAQAASLGFPSGPGVHAHPIQDRTDDEMRALADAAFDEIVAAVTRRELTSRQRQRPVRAGRRWALVGETVGDQRVRRCNGSVGIVRPSRRLGERARRRQDPDQSSK